MIGGKGNGQDRPHGRLAVNGHDALNNPTDSENCGLRWRDDGGESVHVVHAKVADGEGTSGYVRRAQLAGASAIGQFFAQGRDLRNAKLVCFWNDGRDYAVVYRHRYGNVDLGIELNCLTGPTGVQARMRSESMSHARYQNVSVRNLDFAGS